MANDVGSTRSRLWWSTLPALLILAASFLFTPETLPRYSVCHLKRVTGIDCPGCGLTRSFTSISHGRFHDAWSYHPLSFAVYGGVLLLAIWPWMAPRIPADILRRAGSGRVGVLVAVVFVVAFGAHWVARLVTQFPGAP